MGSAVAEYMCLGGLAATKPGSSAFSNIRSATRSARRAQGLATTKVSTWITGLSTAGVGRTKSKRPAGIVSQPEPGVPRYKAPEILKSRDVQIVLFDNGLQ